MSFGPKKLWLKSVLTIALAISPLLGVDASAAGSCQDKILDQCNALQAGVTNTQQASIQTNMTADRNSINNAAMAHNRAAVQGAQASQDCSDMASMCDSQCKGDQKAIKACKQAVNNKADDIKAQSAANADNGSSTGMISTLMGAAMGAGLAYMMMKKQQDQQNQQPPPQPVATGALQINGSLNCQMQDSFHYEDCSSFLTTFCASRVTAAASAAAAGTALNTTPMTGTVISAPGGGLPPTPDCASFNANFCSTSVTPPQPFGNVRPDGAVTQVNIAGTGEGLGTPYCSNVVASMWCSDALYGSTRAVCPSCRQMQTSTSATCAANPALCMAQNSPQQLTQIQANPSCQGDPLFTPGSPYALAGIAAPAVGANGAVTLNNALPVVVLPASTGGANTGTVGANATVGNGAPSTGISVASAGGVNGPGMREGKAVGGASGAAGGGGAIRPSSMGHVGPSELIAAGGVIVAGGPATVSRGPASDVESQFGPSLFATSSQIIRLHCQAGKLNNCP